MTRASAQDTAARILQAARDCLLEDGYAGLSTRRVAERAGVPLSQIHYHFGGKRGVVLEVLAQEDRRLLARQRQMYGADVPLWKRYEQACDFLDDDLGSGYVRVLQEMIAAGWSDREVAARVLSLLEGWLDVLREVAGEAEARFGTLGPFTPDELAGLIASGFLGGESLILLGDQARGRQVRGWLRRVGELIRRYEEAAG